MKEGHFGRDLKQVLALFKASFDTYSGPVLTLIQGLF